MLEYIFISLPFTAEEHQCKTQLLSHWISLSIYMTIISVTSAHVVSIIKIIHFSHLFPCSYNAFRGMQPFKLTQCCPELYDVRLELEMQISPSGMQNAASQSRL